MATTRKKSTSKKQTKKDLEAKIEELEAKLSKISSQLETHAKPAAEKPKETPPPPKPQTTAPPPKPQPKAESPRGSLPKGFEQKPAEKAPEKAEQKAGPPATLQEALEYQWRNAPMSPTYADMKAKIPGFTAAPNRYWARLHATNGTVPPGENWNVRKAKTPGYVAAGNRYFATRARMAGHSADKRFGGMGLIVEGAPSSSQQQAQTAPPPPPPPKPNPAKGSLPKGFTPQGQQQQQTYAEPSSGQTQSKKQSLEEYEKDYLRRLEQQQIDSENARRAAEAAERAKEEAQAKARASSARGSLPKGFEPKPEPKPEPQTNRGSMPKGWKPS